MRGTPIADTRAAVVGTGLIGGSILLRLREAGIDAVGWDPDPTTRDRARRQGLVHPDDLADAVRDRDVVFLSGPLPTLPDTLLTVAAATGEHCLITDVGSTKSTIAATAAEHGLTHRFVPGHPMAGTDRAGLTAATPDLLTGAPWVLCPPADPPLDPFRTLAALLIEVFAARVVPMSPQVHDTAAALASHIPHLLAGSLAGAVARSPLRDAVLALAAGSFRDGTRVAGTPSTRTADMLISNREFVLAQLKPVEGFLADLVAALRDDDRTRLAEHYEQARRLRDALAARPQTPSERTFPATGPYAAELDFLLELGRSGGHLSGCAVDGSTVTYRVYRPTGR
ncbi:MAG TPA: prephenate dehydrogenase/arogenate dehydrogenase family protein [Micromonosporaceae bacterium]